MHKHLLIGFIALFPNVTSAEDLFESVSPSIEEEVSQYNAGFLAENTYFSKRYRIIEVNMSALINAEKVTMRLFDNEKPILIRREKIRIGTSNETATWTGHVVSPSFDDLRKSIPPSEVEALAELGLTAEAFIKSLIEVRLHLAYWDVDQLNGSAHPSFEHIGNSLDQDPPLQAQDRQIARRAFASVDGDLDLRIFGMGLYRILPLKNSPRYHLIMEIDPAKMLNPSERQDLDHH